MAISQAEISTEQVEDIYCPFSGKPVADKDSGDIRELPTLLFVHYGMAGQYAYVSDKCIEQAQEKGIEIIDGEPGVLPEDLASKLTIPNAFILVHDSGWNGINTYGFIANIE